MNPERKHSQEKDANRLPDDEASKVMDSTTRDSMNASADLSAEAKDAETILSAQAGLEQINAEIDAKNASQEEKDAQAVKAAQAGLEQINAEIDERQDKKTADRKKVVELGEKMLKAEKEGKADLKAVTDKEIDAALNKALPTGPEKKNSGEVVELSGEDFEDNDDNAIEVTDADIISHTEDGGDVETSAPSMKSLNKKMKERVAENETEEKFFQEGAELEEAGKLDYDVTTTSEAEAKQKRNLQHATKAGEMGYVEHTNGDLVRGEARSADINESSKLVDKLKSDLEAAKKAYAVMPWYKKLLGRGTVKNLESQLGKAEDKLAEAKAAVKNSEDYHKAKKVQGERKK